MPHHSLKRHDCALHPVRHGGRRGHLTGVDHGEQTPEPFGKFGVFATGDGTTPQEPVERWGRAA